MIRTDTYLSKAINAIEMRRVALEKEHLKMDEIVGLTMVHNEIAVVTVLPGQSCRALNTLNEPELEALSSWCIIMKNRGGSWEQLKPQFNVGQEVRLTKKGTQKMYLEPKNTRAGKVTGYKLLLSREWKCVPYYRPDYFDDNKIRDPYVYYTTGINGDHPTWGDFLELKNDDTKAQDREGEK